MLAMAKKRTLTWADVGIRNAGFRATSRALKFALGWGLATAELGREPETVEEYAETMEESRATAFRDQQAFRKAFPAEVSPARMNEASGSQDRYDELYRRLKDSSKVASEAQGLIFSLGASPAA
jgi:hypothetical protein